MHASTRITPIFSTLQAMAWWALERTVHQGSRHLRSLRTARATAAAHAAARIELAALSDRELRDLGITRDQIGAVVSGGRTRIS